MSQRQANSQLLYQGSHLTMRAKDTWEYASRAGASGVVGIVAVTPENRLLLVEQYRPPVARRVIELPAGLAGDFAEARGESLELAAARELREETGYEPAKLRLLSVGPSSAGLTDETVALFVASNLRKVSDGGGDESEQITVHEVPLNEVAAWLAGKVKLGQLVDFKVFAGLWFLQQSNWIE